VQQAVLAFKQALEAAMKGQGPLPLIEIAQDASTITAAAAAIAGSSSAASALLSSQLSSLTGGSNALLAGAGGCSSSSAKANKVSAAAAATNSQQLFAKGGWMEVFRGKLGKAAAKLAGSAAMAAAPDGSSGGGLGNNVQDVQQPLGGLNSRDLLEVLAVRAAAAGGLLTEADAENAEGFEDAHEELDTSDSSLGALVSHSACA
jgi:hypothetical protein